MTVADSAVFIIVLLQFLLPQKKKKKKRKKKNQVDDKLLFGYSDGTNVFVTFNEEIRPKHIYRHSTEEETGCDPTL